MDPLLARLTSGASRRRMVLVGLGGAAVVTVAVVVAGADAGGHDVAVPTVAVTRAPAPSATPLLVQVGGAVRRPGLVSVPAGARVVDAVAAAGGATGAADAGGLNLAAPVADGQQVLVPARGASAAAPPAASGATGGGTSGGGAGAGGARVSLNSATTAELETLPRIGPALAGRILAWRTAHGAFRSVADLGQVGGIGPKTLAGLRDRVTL